MGEMVNFGEAGRICLNQEIRGVCENCLWWEWDAARQECGNSQYHICPLHRERLFSLKVQARSRLEARLKESRLGLRHASGDGLADPLDAKAGESGIS